MNDPDQTHLDALLRRDFEGTPADDEFTARVMHALPRRRRPSAWTLPAAASIGGLLTWLTLAASPWVRALASDAMAGEMGASQLAGLAVLLGVALLSCAWALEEGA